MKKICIIGAEGYIGSALAQEFKDISVLVDHKNLSGSTLVLDTYEQSFIQSFERIIYLGGITSRKTIREDIIKNIEDIDLLARLMTKKQQLIYASTSAIYQGLVNAKEDNKIDEYDLDNYSLSMLKREKVIKCTHTNSIGLRLGTVVGIAPKLRTDRVHIQMIKTALYEKSIYVKSPHCRRPILSIFDLVQAFKQILNKDITDGHFIYNLSSFNTTIGCIATTIALKTSSKVIYLPNKKDKGFSVDCSQFCKDYDFQFKTTNESLIDELLSRYKELIPAWLPPMKKVECFCCENKDMMELLDLGDQPLANNFVSKDVPTKKFPLCVYRCLQCYHSQLGFIVPPKELFVDYIYVSGTTQTIQNYFKSFADKVIKNYKFPGTVLDIASNDGTQLDKFKDQGWKTYGVDPAVNLCVDTIKKGHNITVGFWGEPSITEKMKDVQFDVIIAQNVFAHVPSPYLFLKECTKIMKNNTVLYIQTSQAEIFQNGEFDTIYHEHLSFFSIKSMQYLCKRCDLILTDVEKVPVHGISYIFTLRKSGNISDSVDKLITEENAIYDPEMPLRYKSSVDNKKFLINSALRKFKEDGYIIIGFGAPAKGNTLLSFLNEDGLPLPEYIIDENPRKGGLYTPGTKIPVVNYSTLQKETRNIVILILAWNFIEEIKNKISKTYKPKQKIVLLIPFPSPYVTIFYENKWLEMTNTSLPEEKVETLLITHFYNEELLLPYWILHHAPMFDNVILIDYDSTDRSVEIIKDLAPSHWKVIKSKNKEFSALTIEDEIREYECSYPDNVYKVVLNITEFLVWPEMKHFLAKHNSTTKPIAIKLFCNDIIDDSLIPLDPDLPLIQQRNRYVKKEFDYSRFIHKNTNSSGKVYGLGRHTTLIPSINGINAILLKYLYTPFPECIDRQMQFVSKQGTVDIQKGWGKQYQFSVKQINEKRKSAVKICDILDNSWINANLLLNAKIVYQHLGLLWSSK